MTKNNSYAPHFRRFVAAAIDATIVSIIGLAISKMLGTDPYSEETNLPNIIDTVLTILASVFYYVGFWMMRDGQTPGKQLMHLRIIREDGKPIDLFTGIIRLIGSIVSGAAFSLGYLWILFDKKRQGWHDKFARTVVVESDNNKPRGCLTGIGFLIPIMIFAGIAIVGGIQENGGLTRITDLVGQKKATTDFKATLKPEAKAILTASDAVFAQIRQEEDGAKLLALNNGNITELTKATRIDPTNPIVWEEVAHAYTWPTTVGTINDGIEAAQKAIELNPTSDNYETLGNLLYRAKQYDETVTALKQAIRLNEKNDSAHFWLARTYAQLGIFDSAIVEYQLAIDILSENNKTGKNDETILMLQKESANLPK